MARPGEANNSFFCNCKKKSNLEPHHIRWVYTAITQNNSETMATSAQNLSMIIDEMLTNKPADRADYTYGRHVDWTSQWLTGLDLKDITLFCQDWGGLIGLRLVAAYPERFVGMAIANTGLPTGTGMTEGFANWLSFSQKVPIMAVGALLQAGSVRELTPAEVAAYDAPFPDESYKEGARQFPTLVPVTPEHAQVAENLAAWKVLEAFDKPVVTCFSDADPVSGGGEKVFQARVPGTKGQPHVILSGGHFLQEDSPAQIVDLVDALAARAHAKKG